MRFNFLPSQVLGRKFHESRTSRFQDDKISREAPVFLISSKWFLSNRSKYRDTQPWAMTSYNSIVKQTLPLSLPSLCHLLNDLSIICLLPYSKSN